MIQPSPIPSPAGIVGDRLSQEPRYPVHVSRSHIIADDSSIAANPGDLVHGLLASKGQHRDPLERADKERLGMSKLEAELQELTWWYFPLKVNDHPDSKKDNQPKGKIRDQY
jgi:hypothetical protein